MIDSVMMVCLLSGLITLGFHYMPFIVPECCELRTFFSSCTCILFVFIHGIMSWLSLASSTMD